MTHQKILAMLDGYSSVKPMPFDVLVEKSGLLPATLRSVLDQMQHSLPASINSAKITDIGGVREVYWPTGMVAMRSGSQGIVINPLTAPRRQPLPQRLEATAKPKPIASIIHQENQMATSTKKRIKASRDLGIAIYNKIIACPGIKRDVLVKHALSEFPDATNKQISKAIWDLVNTSKKVLQEGKSTSSAYRSNTGASMPAAKPVSVKSAPAAAPVSLTDKPAEHVPNDEQFTMMLSDDDHLHLGIGDEMYHLNPQQVARLHAFMGRVQLGAPV